jgi:hypothetical protein
VINGRDRLDLHHSADRARRKILLRGTRRDRKGRLRQFAERRNDCGLACRRRLVLLRDRKIVLKKGLEHAGQLLMLDNDVQSRSLLRAMGLRPCGR